jgi:hypothetical protein
VWHNPFNKLNKCFLSPYHVPDTVLGSIIGLGNIIVNKTDKFPTLWGLHSYQRKEPHADLFAEAHVGSKA